MADRVRELIASFLLHAYTYSSQSSTNDDMRWIFLATDSPQRYRSRRFLAGYTAPFCDAAPPPARNGPESAQARDEPVCATRF